MADEALVRLLVLRSGLGIYGGHSIDVNDFSCRKKNGLYTLHNFEVICESD